MNQPLAQQLGFTDKATGLSTTLPRIFKYIEATAVNNNIDGTHGIFEIIGLKQSPSRDEKKPDGYLNVQVKRILTATPEAPIEGMASGDEEVTHWWPDELLKGAIPNDEGGFIDLLKVEPASVEAILGRFGEEPHLGELKVRPGIPNMKTEIKLHRMFRFVKRPFLWRKGQRKFDTHGVFRAEQVWGVNNKPCYEIVRVVTAKASAQLGEKIILPQSKLVGFICPASLEGLKREGTGFRGTLVKTCGISTL